MTIFGASSANRSRTTNSSAPRAVERRAEAAQSIESMSSPGRYGREPATSVPAPRRRLLIVPNETPKTRRRGTSGKESRAPGTRRRLLGVLRSGRAALEERVFLRAGLGRELEAALSERLDRLGPSQRTGASDEGRREDDAVHEHGREEALDVLRDDVAAAVEKSPGARGPLERE